VKIQLQRIECNVGRWDFKSI